MLEKEKIKIEYQKYLGSYKVFQKEVYKFVKGIKREFPGIDIADTKNRTKTLKSIYKNIDRPDKYHDFNTLLDIKDIAGVRIVCHCEDDLDNLVDILDIRLRQRYSNVKPHDRRKDSDDNKSNSVNQVDLNKKSNPLYRAVHFTFSKDFKCKDEDITLFCEIQVRTVMSDAWAVQDRKYVYGNEPEGETRTLTNSVAGILQACEGLWSMVKTKYKDGAKQQKIRCPKDLKDLVTEEITDTKQKSTTKFDADLKNDKL